MRAVEICLIDFGWNMTAAFDPYRELLNITSSERPPDHYCLLGLKPFESDRGVIEEAAEVRMTALQELANSEYMDASQQLLNEVAAARRCLLDATRRIAYDEELRKRRERSAAAGTRPSGRAASAASAASGASTTAGTRQATTASRASAKQARKLKPALPLGAAAAVAALLAIVLFVMRQPPSQTGNVIVDWPLNQRQGAAVLLDDKPLPMTESDPLLLNVPSGRHRLLFQRSGFQDIPKTVSIRQARIHIVLDWAPEGK
ncbi:MAG: hypothetical protein R3C49_27240 [Planctomycetaceae bacterium]